MAVMELPKDGAEYVHVTLEAYPSDVIVEVSLDNRATWQTVEQRDDEGKPIILVRGPLAPAGTNTIDRTTRLWVRVSDSPEIVVRPGGFITLV